MAEASRNIYPTIPTETRDGYEVCRMVKKHHDKAYADIKLALKYDEQSKRDEAIRFYGLGLKSIAKAVNVVCNGPHCAGAEWDQARSMQQKMRKTARQMKTRLEALEQEQKAENSSPMMNGASGGGGLTDAELEQLESDARLAEEIDDLPEPPSYVQSTADARQVLHIPHGVQLFFINSSGHVSAPSSPGPLKVYRFPKDQPLAPSQPPAFLQVGEWLYPLLPGRSPSLKTVDGVFMFPDMSSLDPGASVGIIFSSQVRKGQKLAFQGLIQQLTAMREQLPSDQRVAAPEVPPESEGVPQMPRGSERAPREEPGVGETAPQVIERGESTEATEEAMDTHDEEHTRRKVSRKIAKGIEIGAEWISWGVVKGAEIGSQLIGSGAKKLKQHLQPEEEPQEIDEKYQTGVLYARKATGVAVKVSVVVLDSVCYLTKRVAEEVGPMISKQAHKMLTNGEDDTDGKRQATVDGVIEVTASGLKGFGKIYRGLEAAAIQLAKSISQATVETVHHKYGEDAGRLTDNSLATVGNIGVSAYNFNNLGVKALAKRTAKDTGKVVVTDLEAKTKQREEESRDK